MKPIFWKEIRENLKWAVLGLIVFSLALSMAWKALYNPNSSSQHPTYESVAADTITMITTLIPSILGAALGFLQILPEQRRDRWAFLVHRPVEQGAIFAGKAAAGLALYFAATLPPWLCICWWASVPGHVPAPFEWGMGFGGLMDILCGVIFYFGGMVTALRQGRWIGSKAIAILGAMWFSHAESDMTAYLWTACIWNAFGILLMASAARGNFVRNGIYSSQGWFARLALLLVFSVGTGAIVEKTADVARALTPSASQEERAYQDYRVTKEGDIVNVVQKSGEDPKILDSNGKEIPLSRDQRLRYSRELRQPWRFRLKPYDEIPVGYRSHNDYFAQGSEIDGTHWYYSYKKRLLEGYDGDSREIIGWMDLNGYHEAGESETSASAFPPGLPVNAIQGEFPNCFVFGNKLYYADYIGLKVYSVMETASSSDFQAVEILWDENYYAPAEKVSIAVGLKDGITVYNATGGTPVCHLPYEHDPAKYEISITATPVSRRIIVQYSPKFDDQVASGYTLPEYYYRYAPDGKPEKQWVLPYVGSHRETRPPMAYAWEVLTPTWHNIYRLATAWIGGKMGINESALDWNDILHWWSVTRVEWLIAFLAGIPCAIVAVIKARPYQLRTGETIFWAVFVLLGGVTGLLVFLALKEWPARIPCPVCKNPRMVDHDECEHCHAGWQPPQHDGTEILASSKN